MDGLPLTRRTADGIIAWRDGAPVPVGQFVAEAAALADRLPAHGGVINLCRDRYRFMRAFAAVLLAGQTNFLPANRLHTTIRDLLERYRGAYILGDHSDETAWPGAIDARDIPPTPRTPREAPPIDPEHTAAVVFTSGSTGQSKPLVKPWRTLYQSALRNAAEMGLTDAGTTSLVATVPPQHMYGLETSVLIPLQAAVAASNDQPFMPAEIADALAAIPGPRVLVSTPAHLRALAGPEPRLPPIATIWSATGPLDPELAARIETVHDTRVAEIYGCSETGSLARREPVRDTTWTLFRDFTLSAEDDGVRASAPDLPAAFTLQDRLELTGTGRFRVLGRSEDLVNIAGKRASLTDLNLSLLRIEGVEDGVVFEPPDSRGDGPTRLAALVVAPGREPETIRAALREWVDEAFLPRPIRMVDRLPRAETGKLPRRAVLELFAAHDRRGD